VESSVSAPSVSLPPSDVFESPQNKVEGIVTLSLIKPSLLVAGTPFVQLVGSLITFAVVPPPFHVVSAAKPVVDNSNPTTGIADAVTA
jgi:hypothetical protein